jgi:hypothetical protein
MADSTFSTLIRDGLFDPSPLDSISRVKTAVARELEALDPTARVISTDFFNHTFAPDFILRWPDTSERRVFLRLTYDTVALAEDVELIDAKNPLIFGLNPHDVDINLDAVSSAVEAQDAMFTQPDAVESLINRKSIDTTATMLGNALAQGGRGTFVNEAVSRFADTVVSGFAGAAALDVERTSAAVNAVQAQLGEVQSTRLTRVMQAVWEGGDGRIDQFPGSPDLTGRLNVEALRYLVTYVDIDDITFWQRVGRRVSITDLAALDFNTNRQNIERLIRANLDVITARAAFYVEDPLGIQGNKQSGGARWGLYEGRLTLETPNWFAVIDESKKDLEDLAPRRTHPVSVATFVKRASRSHLIEAKIQSGVETLTIEHDNGSLATSRLSSIADQYDGGSSVLSAVVSTPSGRVTVDTGAKTATGKTRSAIRMADLLTSTAPLLVDLELEEHDSLAAFLTYHESAGEQPFLEAAD